MAAKNDKKKEAEQLELFIADLRARLSDENKHRLIRKFVSLYGSTEMSKRKAHFFSIGFSKAWEIFRNELQRP